MLDYRVQDRPYKREVAGHDLNYIGNAGLLALSMGNPSHPTVPPAWIADIAGGAYPAVMNILLALTMRQQSGRGCFLDIAMAENLFPFMYWALGEGLSTGQWAGNGAAMVCGGTPRYRLYPTSDGEVVAAGPIEQKFWEEFCEQIQYEPALRDDKRDMAATGRRVSDIIRSQPAAVWRERFAGKDCCCTVVATLQQALADPHFRSRGIFDHVLTNEEGERMPALPVPIMRIFRAAPPSPAAAPLLGAHNSDFTT